MKRRTFLASVAAAVATPASAQQLAGKTITIIYPAPPASSGDVLARLVAEKMRETLKANIIVENRPGAAFRIGVVAAKNAAPDGRTLLVTPFAPMSLHQHSYPKLDYDPFRDFAPVSQLATFDNAIAVNVASPVKTLKDLVEWLKSDPNSRKFGSPSAGTLPHFMGLVLARRIGVELTHVTYRGSMAAAGDVMGGHLPFAIVGEADILPQHKAGKIRIVATTGKAQSKFLPDVGNLIAGGMDAHASGWFAAYAPAGTPQEIVAEISRAMREAVKLPELAEKLAGFGLLPTGTTPEELGAIQKADSDTWGPVIKASGFKPED